jgi:hypothetical protein
MGGSEQGGRGHDTMEPTRELELALAEVVAVWPDSDEAPFWLGICGTNVRRSTRTHAHSHTPLRTHAHSRTPMHAHNTHTLSQSRTHAMHAHAHVAATAC